MLFDALLMLLVFVVLHWLNAAYPHRFFLPTGAVLFLPPQPSQEPSKPRKKKEEGSKEVAVMRVNHSDVKGLPFSDEFSRVSITAFGLAIYVGIRLGLTHWLGEGSLAAFYVLVLITVYALKLAIDTFFLTNYDRKQCLLFGLAINGAFYILYYILGTVEGIYDQGMIASLADYEKHLEVVLGIELNHVSARTLVGLVLFCNFFLVVAMIPNVMKFSNWYSKSLKELYVSEEEEGGDVKDKEAQATVKAESKKVVSRLNSYLFAMLVLLFASHGIAGGYLADVMIDALRAFLLLVCIWVICASAASAIEFNGSFAYRHIVDYFKAESQDEKEVIGKRIKSYVTYIWYYYFQHMLRALIPLLLFLLIIHSKYLHPSNPLPTEASEIVNPALACPFNTNQLEALEGLYSCQSEVTTTSQEWLIGGVLSTQTAQANSDQPLKNIEEWGLLTPKVLTLFYEQLFWYFSISLYLMTVGYILLLRKTVYEL